MASPKKLEQMARARAKRYPEFTVQGKTGTVKALAVMFGATYSTVSKRIKNLGWDLERALTTPSGNNGSKAPRLPMSTEYPGRIFKKDGLLVKTCTSCRLDKPLEDFWKRDTSADGLSARCGKCLCADKRGSNGRIR